LLVIRNGLSDVRVEPVAAHEVGHAIQDATCYVPMKLRAGHFPLVNFSSQIWLLLFVAEIFIEAPVFIRLALILSVAVLAFHIVTLPVEINASTSAYGLLRRYGIFSSSEAGGVRGGLTAAAFTYIAAALTTFLTLLYLLLLSQSSEWMRGLRNRQHEGNRRASLHNEREGRLMTTNRSAGAGDSLLPVLARNWWVLVLRGLAAIVFGVLAFLWPSITLFVLVLLFGAYMLVDGIFAIVAAVRAAGREARWWLLLIEGVLGVLAGLVAFFWPGLTALALLYFIAAWAIVTGILEIVGAIRLRQEIEGEWALGLSGALSVLFGILLVVIPAPAGLLSLVWLIGAYALAFGVLVVVLAFRVRNRGTVPHTAAS
jgi:uncharacterized membrane protein HdeD (DUF308 family)